PRHLDDLRADLTMKTPRRAKNIASRKAAPKARPAAKSKPAAKRTVPTRAKPSAPAAATAASSAPETLAPPLAPQAALEFTFALGSAAHELKNGLVPLGMTLQLIERKALGGETVPPQDLSFARGQVRRLAQLVNDLLDVTHLDTDHFPLRPRA